MPYDTGFFYCKAFEIPRSLAKRHFVKVIFILFYCITNNKINNQRWTKIDLREISKS